MTVQLKGTTAIRETSRERQTKGGQQVVTLKYQGLYLDLLAGEPAPGLLWVEDNRFGVESANTVRTKGGLGETTVVYTADGSLQSIPGGTKDIKIEIIWERNDAPLLFQKQFRDDSVGCTNIECLSLVEDYLQARTAAKRTAIKALITAFGSPEADKYLELRAKGIDSILRFLPIIRKTSTTVLRPSSIGANLGKVQAPTIGSIALPVSIEVGNPLTPATTTVDTLLYVKMRDDATKTGRSKQWERIEEWHGYPSAEISLAMFRT